jgi:hypothetical protein
MTTNTFKPNPAIGKLKGELNVSSKTGKVNHVFNGHIVDPKTGEHIGVRIVIPSVPTKYDVASKKFVPNPGGELEGVVYLKGVRTQADYEARRYAFNPIETKFTVDSKKETKGKAQRVIEVVDDEITF